MKIFISLIVAVLLLLPQGVAALCVQGDCINGQGTVVLPDGRRYVGEFQDGIRTGRGLMTFPDGTKYLGDWRSDKPHGQGILSSVGKFEYVGEFAKGVREGQGTLETVDGKRYNGQWQKDVPHGRGTITYPDGATFVGQFDKGRRSGQGEAIYSDGTKYTGAWHDDLPNGQGTKVFADGVQYSGEFRNGLRHGQGTIVNPDGSSYAGQWQNDVLVKKEEVAAEAEVATVKETEELDLAEVVEAPAAATQPPVSAEISQAVLAETPSLPAGKITNIRGDYASVNQNGVLVRSGPSTEYRIVRSVSRGFPVQVIGQQNNWSKVKDFVGQEGWIYLPFLGPNNSAIVKVSKVNIRSGPGLRFSALNQVEFGSVLQLNNIKNDWYQVTTEDGMVGWLYRKLTWPAGLVLAPSHDVAESAVSGVTETMQPAGAEAPVARESIKEAGREVKVGAPVAVPEPAVTQPEAGVKPTEIPAAASATDEPVRIAPAESAAQPDALPAEAADERVYAGVAQNRKGANIRSAPLLAADVLRSVPPGFPLAVIESQGNWFLVEDFRARRGWVYAALLTELQTVIIKVSKGNLRRGPSLIEEIVAKLDYGTIMVIDETRGDWLQVSNSEGLVGWLHRAVVWP